MWVADRINLGNEGNETPHKELGYFSAGIIDYVIYTKTDNLAFTGISRGRTFCFGTQKYILFVKSIY